MPSMVFNTKKLCVHTLMLPFLYKGLWSIVLLLLFWIVKWLNQNGQGFLSPTNLIVNWHHFGKNYYVIEIQILLKGIVNPSTIFMISTFNYLDVVYLWSSPCRCYENNCQAWPFTWQQKCIKIRINFQF